MTGFDINEALKERCTFLGASFCYTEFRPKGGFIYDGACWYNKITLPPQLSSNFALIICSTIDGYLEELEVLGFTDILTEVMMSDEEKSIYYWIFCDREEFLEKDILEDK